MYDSWDETVDFLDGVENDMLASVQEDSWEADELDIDPEYGWFVDEPDIMED